MLRRLSITVVGLSLCLCCVTTISQAQANPACRVQYQYWAFDLPIPGATCETEAPFLAICSVGTSKCTAICQDCLQNTPKAGTPINLANGNVFITQTDITVPGLGGGLNLSRTWNSEWPFGEAAGSGMFGGNWRSSYEESIFVDGSGLVKYVRATGGIWTLGLTTPEWPLIYLMIAPANGGATLVYDGSLWTLTFKSGEKRVFDGPTGHLLSIIDRNGNTTQLTYDSSNRLTTVTDPASRHLTFTYASPSSNLVTGVSSDVGISLIYAYDNQSRLATITKPDLTTVSFQYDSYSMISTVLDSNNKVLESHTYDGQRRGLTSSRAGGVESMSVTYPVLSF